jgi:ACS family pantothenate transporter-like MFS transporter
MADEKSPSVVEHVIDPSSIHEAAAYAIIQEKPKKKWTSYLWDTLDKSPEERRFLFKLDAALLTFASLGKNP